MCLTSNCGRICQVDVRVPFVWFGDAAEEQSISPTRDNVNHVLVSDGFVVRDAMGIGDHGHWLPVID